MAKKVVETGRFSGGRLIRRVTFTPAVHVQEGETLAEALQRNPPSAVVVDEVPARPPRVPAGGLPPLEEERLPQHEVLRLAARGVRVVSEWVEVEEGGARRVFLEVEAHLTSGRVTYRRCDTPSVAHRYRADRVLGVIFPQEVDAGDKAR